MSTCTSCGPAPSVPLPVLTPAPTSPTACEGASPCIELTDARCVFYSGKHLEVLDILNGDDLNKILLKINEIYGLFGNSVVLFNNSSSIEVLGNGSLATPFRVRARIDTSRAENLLKVSRSGLSVIIDREEIIRFLTVIKADPDLSDLFCGICDDRPLGYAVPQNLTVSIDTSLSSASVAAFSLSWEFTGLDPETQIIEYRLAGTSTWTTFGQPLRALTLSVIVPGLLNNTTYNFRVRNSKDLTGIAPSNVVALQRTTTAPTDPTPTPALCAAPTSVSTVESTELAGVNLQVSFTALTAISSSYEVSWQRISGTDMGMGLEMGTAVFTSLPSGTRHVNVQTNRPDGQFTGTIRSLCGTRQSVAVDIYSTVVTPPSNPECPSLLGLVALTLADGTY